MEKDLIFFGEQGLTSTSAGHIANLAKEYIAGLEEFINNLNFYNIDIQLLSSQETKPLSKGNDNKALAEIGPALTTIAEAKSLIAWLREAIKAKEHMSNELSSLDLATWCKNTGKVYPELHLMESYTEEMEINKMSVKDRNNYFRLQTYAAIFGKLIHPDGQLSIARARFADKLRHPTELQGNGRDGIIYSYSPTVTHKELEDTFFELQNAQRSFQAEFNKVAHTIKENVFAEQQRRFKEQAAKFIKQKTVLQELNTEFTQYTEAEIKKIADLKIVIPDNLKTIFNAVKSLGKSE